MTAGRPIEKLTAVNVFKQCVENVKNSGPFDLRANIERAIDEFFKILDSRDQHIATLYERIEKLEKQYRR